MPTFSTGWCHKPGPTLWVYNPPPSSPSFPSRHLQEQFKTTPTTTPTPSGCRISPLPSPTTSLLRPPPTPPPRFLHTDAAAPRRRFLDTRRRARLAPSSTDSAASSTTPAAPRSSIYVAGASRPLVSSSPPADNLVDIYIEINK